MKTKRFVAIVVMLLVLSMCFSLSACGGAGRRVVRQTLPYAESIAAVANPDRGFYRPVYVKLNENGISYNKNIISADTQLYHLRIDIAAFSGAVNGAADKRLTQAALDGVEELLSYLRAKDKNAIVRFAYDPSFGGSKDKEPQLSMILQHIEQIGPILERYAATITAVEAGLIGPWGEMHSSAVATAANITPIVDAFLTHTETVPVSVRTPKMMYDYLGITVRDIDGYTVAADSKACRLGLYNDGYLGSATDLGTYTDRERETEFLHEQTAHLPYGGEVVVPESSLHDIDVCLPEMNRLHLSYLNVEWNDRVIAKWKNSRYTASCGTDTLYYGASAFDYIRNHLGYRFVLRDSVFTVSARNNTLRVALTLQNVGFGNLNKTKHAALIFIDKDGAEVCSEKEGTFVGTETWESSVDLRLPKGEYDVYLRLYGDEADDVPLYCVRFANDGLWRADIKANKIGSITVGDGDFALSQS